MTDYNPMANSSEAGMSPQEYFDHVKTRKHHITDEQLLAVYDNCLDLLNKYRVTGQVQGMEKILFHLDCIDKEREIVKMGIDTFVYRDDIEYYIEEVASNVVKIIDLPNYEREIPDEIVSVIEKVKDKFDKLYVVFTDYTGRQERKVEEYRRQKDPILFGTFQNTKTRAIIDRFYYLGDWVDEYCDLTLDKMVNETKNAGRRNIVHTISTPKDIEELRNQLANLQKTQNGFVVNETPKKKHFFDRVKSFLIWK